ncbi:MAG: hypothetical protein R3Y35_00030 [Clostridia bacterium]
MDNNQLENLLKIASQRLGTTPEALKQAAENGTMNNLVGGKHESEMISKVLSDPEAAKKLLSTPQAQKLLKMLDK